MYYLELKNSKFDSEGGRKFDNKAYVALARLRDVSDEVRYIGHRMDQPGKKEECKVRALEELDKVKAIISSM
jgi:methyl coenzyme M reductase gamma subunit